MRRTKKRLNKKRLTKKRRGGNAIIKKNTINRDNFRNMFMKFFKQIGQKSMNDLLVAFSRGLKSNKLFVNTLIPVNNEYIPIDKYSYKPSETDIIFIPVVSVLIKHITNNNDLKQFIEIFIENKGNINLQSYAKNVTALSTAIKLNNIEIIQFLLDRGADISILSDEDNTLLKQILEQNVTNENIVESPEQIKGLNPNITKLDITLPLPSNEGYDINIEPDFWKPIFTNINMLELRNKIHTMMINDINIDINNLNDDNIWSICRIVKTLIPTYNVATKNEPYMTQYALQSDLPKDFSNYNIILCTTLLLYALINEKLIGQDYMLVFKGGKAIQLELSKIPNYPVYKSEDIDVVVMPNQNVSYNRENIKNIAGHLSYLIKWFLQMPSINLSVLEPNPSNLRSNPNIYKLSYVKNSVRYDYRQRKNVPEYKQFSDIDFKETYAPFFEKITKYTFDITELDTNILFICPNIGSLLNEKIYYYSKYYNYKEQLTNKIPITDEEYKNLTIDECNRILDKFKRAILVLNNGLQKNRFPDLTEDKIMEKEIASIKNRLTTLKINNDVLKSLYNV